MSETSTLISCTGRITRAELAKLPTPLATETHIPIPHAAVVETLIETSSRRQIAVVCEEFTVHAHNVARHVGHSGMHVLVLPYPLEARPAKELRQIAQEYYPKVLELLGVTA